MYTSKTVIDSLKSIGVTEDLISFWENAYSIPVIADKAGRKFYNENHLKIFRKIQKYNALGYTQKKIEERLAVYLIQDKDFKNSQGQINEINTQSQVASIPPSHEMGNGHGLKILSQKDLRHQTLPYDQHSNQNQQKLKFNLSLIDRDPTNKDFVLLVERLIHEKNNLLDDVDGLKAHVAQLLLDRERLAIDSLEYQKTISDLNIELASLIHSSNTQLPEKIHQESVPVAYKPVDFVGVWKIRSKLLKVYYDTMGINIEEEKHKTIKIAEPPQRIYGTFATFITNHKYTSNPLWMRLETSRFSLIDFNHLEGEIDIEYFVDEVPVAKAVYYTSGVRE